MAFAIDGAGKQTLKSPFPYFGGKRLVAPAIWQAFGNDVHNYVEPFAGSLAVLLARKNWRGHIETVNELNPYISNFFRALQADPEKTAYYADYPVNETDLHARHYWLIKQDGFRQAMLDDPEYHDCKIAGWWVWGLCAWIGQGWCDPAQVRLDGLPSKKLPHLGNAGMGIHRPSLGDAGRGINRTSSPATVQDYFQALSERFRRVRVSCGDWARVMGESVTCKLGTTAILLDPPYLTGSDLYGGGVTNVAKDVLDWCKTNWGNPKLRIALCGYEGEFEVPSGWTCHAWKQGAGYQSGDNGNSERERVWFSPACLPLSGQPGKQMSLFEFVA